MTDHSPARGLDLLAELYGDREMAGVFSAGSTIEAWKQVEAALAHAQGRLGIIEPDRAAAIEQVCADPASIDEHALWDSARNVGYPILGLVRQLDAALDPQHRGSLHLGATTQDIMDSGLALQLDAAMGVLERRLGDLGEALADLTQQHAGTVMAGRTHGQQAVPTTLGAKLGVYLAEVMRHRNRLLASRDDVRRVSLFGAGGTSDALGSRSAKIRTMVAERLGLVDATVPWHASRDSIVHVAAGCVGSATTAARLAREVTDLSRTEIGEVTEAVGHHRGASSTMPQKANPIFSESIIGFAVAARTTLTGLSRAAEVGHERSAGEWQVEWSLLPALFVDTGSALALAGELVRTLAVHPDRMLANLDADGGLIMSESAMITLAPHLGREQAHDAVYALAQQARREGSTLRAVLADWLAERPDLPTIELDATSATGDAERVAAAAVDDWRRVIADHPRPWKDHA